MTRDVKIEERDTIVHALETNLVVQRRSITVEKVVQAEDTGVKAQEEEIDHQVASTQASTAVIITAEANQAIVAQVKTIEGIAESRQEEQSNRRAEMDLD